MASWFKTPEVKVGLLVVLTSGLVGGMAMKVSEGAGFLGGTNRYYFKTDSAGGLIKNSAVKMAGIKVGTIDDIILEDGKAKIVVALDRDTALTESARVMLKADGILGDKHIEVIPGQAGDSLLRPGSEIKTENGKGGMDDVMSDVSRVAKSLNELMDVLNHAVKEGDDSTRVGRIVGNIEKITNDLSQITAQNKDKLGEIIDRVRNISKNIDTYINEESLARVDRSLKNIEEITTKLNKGEGTLGRLINDDQTVESLNSAIENVNKFMGGATKLETSIDFHSEYLAGPSQTKSYLGLKIQPGLDRYYLIQVVDDPVGVKSSETTKYSNNGGPTQTYDQTVTYKNRLAITAIFAKNFYNWTLKGGIIESNGGVGVDYHLLGEQLMVSTELFNFREIQWRAFLRYNFFKGMYVTAGGDNLLSSDGLPASAFIGAGLFITNDDLKLLAAKFAF